MSDCFLAIVVIDAVIDDQLPSWFHEIDQNNIKVCFNIPSIEDDKYIYGFEWIYNHYMADYYMIIETSKVFSMSNLITFLQHQDKEKLLLIGENILTRSAASIVNARIHLKDYLKDTGIIMVDYPFSQRDTWVDKIYCINLDSRPDRWNRMEERLSRWPSIKVERLRASCPSDDDIKNDPDYSQDPKIYSCSMSHMRIWKQMLKEGWSCVFVLEDDIIFHRDWLEITQKKLTTIEQEDPSWDAIFLNLSRPLSVENDWSPISQQHMTGAYILSRKGAAWLVKSYPRLQVADAMTWWLQSCGHSYGYFPFLAIQEYQDSDIQSLDHLEGDQKFLMENIKNFSHLYLS